MCKTFSSFLPAIFFLILLHHTQTYALSGKFLHISDIHLDPLFNTDTDPVSACRSVSDSKHPLGIYGCDSSPALVSSTIQQMAAVDPNPDFIVVSGDLVFHGVPTEPIMNTTLINLINMFQKFYPNTLVLPVVGNHDVFVPDTIGPDDHGLAVLLSFWDNAFNNIAAQNPQATTTFLQGGYYYVPLPNNVYVIVLNTVYYLPDDTAVPNGDADPAGQFQFLRTTLDMVVNTKGRAIITQHVPQGVGRTATTQLFNPLYENTMQEIMLLYANSIMGVLTGHLHRDLFRIYYQPDGTTPAVPVLLNGAVTPTDDSNPSFTHFSYNATALLNYDKYFVDISDKDNTWELEYSFGTAFPDYPGVIDAQYLDYVLSEFKKKKILHEYEDQSVGGCSQGISGNHCFYICSTQETMFDAFQECVKNCS